MDEIVDAGRYDGLCQSDRRPFTKEVDCGLSRSFVGKAVTLFCILAVEVSMLKEELSPIQNCPADVFHRQMDVCVFGQIFLMDLHFCFTG